MTDQKGYSFNCPDCKESLEVNDAMREVLIEKGCVICGATVTDAAFCDDVTIDST